MHLCYSRSIQLLDRQRWAAQNIQAPKYYFPWSNLKLSCKWKYAILDVPTSLRLSPSTIESLKSQRLSRNDTKELRFTARTKRTNLKVSFLRQRNLIFGRRKKNLTWTPLIVYWGHRLWLFCKYEKWQIVCLQIVWNSFDILLPKGNFPGNLCQNRSTSRYINAIFIKKFYYETTKHHYEILFTNFHFIWSIRKTLFEKICIQWGIFNGIQIMTHNNLWDINTDLFEPYFLGLRGRLWRTGHLFDRVPVVWCEPIRFGVFWQCFISAVFW